jgi:hypothetical protein
MADYKCKRVGARTFWAAMQIPNDGGVRTLECGPLPEDPEVGAEDPRFINPVVAMGGRNVHAQTYYQDDALTTYDPLTRMITLTYVNTTPGAGELGDWEITVWLPHSKVR